MDFHTLSRRQLQALCKKNKIAANLTNLAMADALKSLHIVEGIDELWQPSQSETTQSSIELPAVLEVTSPYVPPSGVRSTRRRQLGKDAENEIETVKSISKTRLACRKNLVNDVSESQDGSLMKDNVDDGKMDALMTPAPLGVTGRRKKVKEDSTVTRAYSTRRSVRLAEKHTKMSNEVDNGTSSEIYKQLSTEDSCLNLDTNLQEVSEFGGSDEKSGVTGSDINTTSVIPEECGFEVVSVQKQDVPIGEEINLGSSAEEEESGHIEASDPEQEMDLSDVTSGRVVVDSERETELDEERLEKVKDSYCQKKSALTLSDEVGKSGKAKAEEGEHHIEVHDPEQEMNKSSNKEAGIEFETDEREHCSQVHDTEQEMKESSDEETGIGFEADEREHHFEVHDSDKEMKESSDEETGIGFEADEREHHFDVHDSEKEMKESSDEEAGIGFEAEESEHCSQVHDPEQEAKESSEKEEGSGFEAEAELDEEEEGSVKTEDPSGETMATMVTPLNLNNTEEIGFGTVAELGKKRSDETEDLVDISTYEVEAPQLINDAQQLNVKDTMDGLSSAYSEESEGNAAEYFKNIVIENKDADSGDAYLLNMTLVKLTELNLQQATGEVASGNAGKLKFIDHSDILAEPNKENVTFGHEGSSENGEQGKDEAPLVAEHLPNSWIPSEFAESDSQLIVPKLTCKKSASNILSKPVNDGMAVFSDNKENIGSGKVALAKQKIKKDGTIGKNKNESLDGLSVRKLSKMLKEKLEITQKSRKDDEHGNHDSSSEVMSRSALQTLAED